MWFKKAGLVGPHDKATKKKYLSRVISSFQLEISIYVKNRDKASTVVVVLFIQNKKYTK